MKKNTGWTHFYEKKPVNFLRVMKLLFVLMTVTSLSISAKTFSQYRVTLDVRNVGVMELFKEIQKKTNLYFVYNVEDLRQFQNLSVTAKNESVETVLQRVFGDKTLEFVYEGEVIIVKPKAETATPQQRNEVMGKVMDKFGTPLPGVSVLIKGTTLGVATDVNGLFKLELPKMENMILVFSFMGMESQEVRYTGQKDLKIYMQEATAEIDEVVVVGYGTTRKKDLTGSVVSVKTAEIKDVPFMSVDDALAGKAAGVAVVKADGSPGGAVRIRIRGGASLLGTNDPLYVIDGIPTQVTDNYISGQSDITNPLEAANYGEDFNNSVEGAFSRGLNNLAGLNISDIESIDILKDASATAIYGSKAANGVVIITTKRGRQDMKPQFNFNYYVGVTTPIKEKVLNAAQYKLALQEAATNFLSSREASGRPMTGSQVEQANKILNDPSFFGNADTDWVGLVLRNGITQNVDVSVSGGGKNSKYYTSLSYTGQEGTLIGTDFKRISGKISLDNDIAKWFRLYANLNYGYTKNNLTNGIYGQALTAPPVFAPFNEDGSYAALGDLSSDYRGYQNPLAVAQGTNLAKDYLLKGSLAAEITFLRDFKFKSTVSVSYDAYNQLNYVPSFVEVGGFYGREDSQGGLGTQANSTTINTFFENTLTWDKEFNQNHRLNVLAGTSWEDYRSDYFSATGRGYPDDDILNNLSSAATAVNVKGANPENRNSLLSFYLRANYIWKDRYLFTFTGRADASSKFAPDNQYGFFPSGAIAWRISQENFMRDAEWIDEIKLRASAGKTGTQSIGDHMWRTLYTTASYGGKNALIPTQLGNDKIKWESTVQKDLGLDFSFWNGRLAGTFGYYHKVTDGALLNLTPAPSSSYPTVVFNIAKVRNEGLEFDVHGDFIRKSNFKWSGALNISRNISKVLDVAGNPFSDPNDRDNLNLGTSVVKEGEPLGLLWGRVATGIIKSEEELAAVKKEMPYWSSFDPYLSIGDVRYEFDETGYWKEDVIGHATPEFFGGYTNTFTWKNLSLLALFTFSYGNDLMYQKDVSDMAMNSLANRGTRVLNHYSENNTASNRPRYVLGNTNMLTSLNVYDASYLKLKSLTLSYNLPKQICQKCRLNALSVYATATNLFTITSYPGPDPEVSDDPTSVIGGGRDVSTYPTVKSYTFGIRFNF